MATSTMRALTEANDRLARQLDQVAAGTCAAHPIVFRSDCAVCAVVDLLKEMRR